MLASTRNLGPQDPTYGSAMSEPTVDESTRCRVCGFVASAWTDQDLGRTLAHTDDLLTGWSVATRSDLADDVSSLADAARDEIAVADGDAQRVHTLWHALVAIADHRRDGGDVVARQAGSLEQINRSDGGVPKKPVAGAEIDHGGVVGDAQAARIHHGRPWQALCLWSADVIDEIAAEGHPIRAGAAGENITIRGIDWGVLRAGTILDIGSVRCQISAPAEPCTKNSRWFVDGAIDRMDHVENPGSSRWYASVVRPGSISTGAAVVVEPVT